MQRISYIEWHPTRFVPDMQTQLVRTATTAYRPKSGGVLYGQSLADPVLTTEVRHTFQLPHDEGLPFTHCSGLGGLPPDSGRHDLAALARVRQDERFGPGRSLLRRPRVPARTARVHTCP